MRRRPASVLVALSLVALAGCGATEKTTAESAPEPAAVIDLHYADVAGDYTAASDALRQRGRDVVDRLLAGDVASVYEQSAPEVKAEVTLAEVEQTFAEGRAKAPIGPRVDERVIPFGPERGLYLADYAQADERVRFQIGFGPSGLMPLVQPVTPLPPDPRATQPATAKLRLPFEGLWWAAKAPTPELGNHHAVASDQRHAFDFLIWRDGSTYRGEGKDNADYWAWGQAVRAPAQGTVVAVQDGLADIRPGTEPDTARPAGNHVVIDLGHDEYAVLAHFQKGSIRSRRGRQGHLGPDPRAGRQLGQHERAPPPRPRPGQPHVPARRIGGDPGAFRRLRGRRHRPRPGHADGWPVTSVERRVRDSFPKRRVATLPA